MGRPKHLLPFGSQTMLERTVEILRQVVAPVVVVAAKAQELPPLPQSVMVVRDEQEYLGPLAGLAGGLGALRPYVAAAYASACDVPLLKPEFIRAVIACLDDFDLAVPFDGTYHHPLAAVYRTQLEDRARELLSQRRMRPLFLIEQSRSRLVSTEDLRSVDGDLDSLRNTNTPEEYSSALADAGLGGPTAG